MHETSDILPANKRNVSAEIGLKKLDQASPMARFFLLHAFENGGRSREGLFQTFGVFGVDALVFLFERNGER